MRKKYFFVGIIICCVGCGTTNPDTAVLQNAEDASALFEVAGALSGPGGEMTDEQLKNLEKHMHDKETVSAVQHVTQSLSGQPVIKYCPSTGKRYAGHLEKTDDCPVPLELLEP